MFFKGFFFERLNQEFGPIVSGELMYQGNEMNLRNGESMNGVKTSGWFNTN